MSIRGFSPRSWWYGALGLLSLIVLMGQLTFAQFKELGESWATAAGQSWQKQ